MIYTFVAHNRAVASSSSPGSGFSTTETWACAATEQSDLGIMRATCTELRVARYLLVPEVVLAVAMLVLAMWFRVRVAKEQRSSGCE
jgi:hypothetical protein